MAQLKYWGNMMALTGKRSESVGVQSVRDALSFIEKQYGRPAYKEAKRMLITVDGVNIQLLTKEKTSLSSEAVVTFYPLSGGG